MNIVKMMIPKSMTVYIHGGDTVCQGLEALSRHSYTAIPVLDEDDRYIGAVAEGDFLRFLMAEEPRDRLDMEKCQIGNIIRKEFCPAISIDANVDTVIDAILEQNFVPVVDSRGALCGIVTRRRLIAYFAGRDLPL